MMAEKRKRDADWAVDLLFLCPDESRTEYLLTFLQQASDAPLRTIMNHIYKQSQMLLRDMQKLCRPEINQYIRSCTLAFGTVCRKVYFHSLGPKSFTRLSKDFRVIREALPIIVLMSQVWSDLSVAREGFSKLLTQESKKKELLFSLPGLKPYDRDRILDFLLRASREFNFKAILDEFLSDPNQLLEPSTLPDDFHVPKLAQPAALYYCRLLCSMIGLFFDSPDMIRLFQQDFISPAYGNVELQGLFMEFQKFLKHFIRTVMHLFDDLRKNWLSCVSQNNEGLNPEDGFFLLEENLIGPMMGLMHQLNTRLGGKHKDFTNCWRVSVDKLLDLWKDNPKFFVSYTQKYKSQLPLTVFELMLHHPEFVSVKADLVSVLANLELNREETQPYQGQLVEYLVKCCHRSTPANYVLYKKSKQAQPLLRSFKIYIKEELELAWLVEQGSDIAKVAELMKNNQKTKKKYEPQKLNVSAPRELCKDSIVHFHHFLQIPNFVNDILIRIELLEFETLIKFLISPVTDGGVALMYFTEELKSAKKSWSTTEELSSFLRRLDNNTRCRLYGLAVVAIVQTVDSRLKVRALVVELLKNIEQLLQTELAQLDTVPLNQVVETQCSMAILSGQLLPWLASDAWTLCALLDIFRLFYGGFGEQADTLLYRLEKVVGESEQNEAMAVFLQYCSVLASVRRAVHSEQCRQAVYELVDRRQWEALEEQMVQAIDQRRRKQGEVIPCYMLARAKDAIRGITNK